MLNQRLKKIVHRCFKVSYRMQTTEVIYELNKIRVNRQRRIRAVDIEPIAKELDVFQYRAKCNWKKYYYWSQEDFNELKRKLEEENVIFKK